MARTGTSAQKPKNEGKNWTIKIKEICDVHQGPYLQMWNSIIVISCVFAVSLDPLFFYVVNIDQKQKCLQTDKTLKIVALVMRSLTDVIFLVHLICEICDSVLLVGVFFKMRGSGYLEKRKVLNFFLLAQYLPRIYRIHLSSNNLSRTGIWAKGAFNFFLYILASHVLGTFWYFFSIQRETSCWHRACKNPSMGCMSRTFFCDNSTTPRIIALSLNESCPINVTANTTPPFDFGIFLDSLQSGNTASLDFPSKFFYSFWWGLRNLSNFGTNLTTSTYVWENLFAILISIIGLLLFLYLLGNVQTFMQLATTESEEIRRKIKMKERQIEEWMVKKDLPEDLKKEIKKNIKQKLKENKDADLENLFSILPWYTKKPLKRFLFMSTLRTVPMLKEMDEKVLKMICDYLKPVLYDENSFVIRTGELLDRMIFITEGFIWTYVGGDQSRHGGGSSSGSQSSSMPINTLKKGLFYGEELLYWASSPSHLPISAQTVQCHTKVVAFVLMAKDLTSIVSKCSKCALWRDSNNMNHSSNNNNINVTHHGQPLLSGIESSTSSTPRIRYLKPAVRPH
ncbi:cyclic nucleotide-gated ion channel 1-like [Pyrus ussuriensis x Pyrus communis]|uniref:Cyclic nucleotide-gated ion channel 1-like n=1 Tax=Pyrus ussuriensis x Pyrus communis TaxID=2448454 RepID=A0A5N5I6X8_9ROSA|nr:cyclic nucleotide-gated ion channel 1-like [Pyrus ussuriensis x Pyrus communis]